MKGKLSLSEKEKTLIKSLLEEGKDVTQITEELGLRNSNLVYDVTYATPIKSRISIATRKYNISISSREIETSYQKVIRTIRQIRKDRGPLKILEQGCGNGRFASTVAVEFPDCQIDGIDMSQAGIDHARRVNPPPNTNFWVADGYDVGRNDSYDIVYHVNVLEHVPEKEPYLEESLRLLKQDGVLIVAFPSEEYWRFWGFPKFLACLLLRRPFQTHAYSVERVSRFLKEKHLHVSIYRWGFFIPRRLYYYVPLRMLKKFGESLQKIEMDMQLLNVLKPMMFVCYIVSPSDSPSVASDEQKEQSFFRLLNRPWTLAKTVLLLLVASLLMFVEVVLGKKTFFSQN